MAASAASGLSQYAGLTTDRHGTKAAFSSRLSIQGEAFSANTKLFEVDRDGRLKVLPHTQVVIGLNGFPTLRFRELSRPEYSSGGTRMAFTEQTGCVGGSSCLSVELLHGQVVDQEWRTIGGFAGRARISANGRWALFSGSTSMANPDKTLIKDLETGKVEASRDHTGWMNEQGRRVADDGTALNWAGPASLSVTTPGKKSVRIDLPVEVGVPVISADAQTAVIQTRHEPAELWMVDLRTSRSWPVVSGAEGCAQPVLSDDGSTLMFLSGANWAGRNDSLAAQVWTMDLGSGELRQWSEERAGIISATISGDGRVVWAMCRDGRLLRIDGASGEASTMVETAPWPFEDELIYAGWAPGSRYRLVGVGLARARVKWNGEEWPVVRSEDNLIEFLIPWETPLGLGTLEVTGQEPRFQPSRLTQRITAYSPKFIKADRLIHALRADGSPLTEVNRAYPGEEVTLLMRGLGPCDREGKPLEIPKVFEGGRKPLEVTDFRMDPHTTGTYRVKVILGVEFHGEYGRYLEVIGPPPNYASDTGFIMVSPRP
jgi:hypothetical protein